MSDNDKLEKLLTNVSKVTGYPKYIIKSDWRKREVVEARHSFCIVAKTLFGFSLKNIGRKINYSNHATVIWAIHNNHIPEIQQIVNNVIKQYYETDLQNTRTSY